MNMIIINENEFENAYSRIENLKCMLNLISNRLETVYKPNEITKHAIDEVQSALFGVEDYATIILEEFIRIGEYARNYKKGDENDSTK